MKETIAQVHPPFLIEPGIFNPKGYRGRPNNFFGIFLPFPLRPFANRAAFQEAAFASVALPAFKPGALTQRATKSARSRRSRKGSKRESKNKGFSLSPGLSISDWFYQGGIEIFVHPRTCAQLPASTFHLPPSTFNFPPSTFHLPLSTGYLFPPTETGLWIFLQSPAVRF